MKVVCDDDDVAICIEMESGALKILRKIKRYIHAYTHNSITLQ